MLLGQISPYYRNDSRKNYLHPNSHVKYFLNRAEAEERYGKALLKLAKTGENGVEIG